LIVLASLKSRVLVVLVVWLAFAQLGSLWLYARKHEEAATLLQDTLVAERFGFIVRLLDKTPSDTREKLLHQLSSPLIHVTRLASPTTSSPVAEGTRPHLFEHLVGLFLDRPDHRGIKTAHRFAAPTELQPTLLSTFSTTLNPEPHHLPEGTLEEIRTVGQVTTEITLSDGDRFAFVTPLLTVSPFSPVKLWAPLGAMLCLVLLSGAWMLSRATRPPPFINYHAGLNPTYRGQYGGCWALAQNDRGNFGVTVHLVDAGVDTGATLYTARAEATGADTVATYHYIQLVSAVPLIERAVDDALNGSLVPHPPLGPSRQWFRPTVAEYLSSGLRRGVW
jgi:hypothetical protein